MTSTHLRGVKLVVAFAFALLAGVGSYSVTYRVLVLVSEPSATTAWLAPVAPGTTGALHAATSPAPHPLP